MTFSEFQTFVTANATSFAGVHQETSESLAAAERSLGVVLQLPLKWLLAEYGYSAGSGIPNLAESVKTTLRCRKSFELPRRYVIIDDRADAGVVILDTDSPAGRVIWIASHEVSKLGTAEPFIDVSEFPDYAAWAAHCLEVEDVA